MDGDEDPAKAWKDHNADCQVMHLKVDRIASRLGIYLCHPGMEQLQYGGFSRKERCHSVDEASGSNL